MSDTDDLTNYVFNNITVLYKHGNVWHCQCNCAEHNEFDLTDEQIAMGVIQNCGCVPVVPKRIKHNILGQKFNSLTVRSYVGKGKWLCKCDCGNFKIISSQHLRDNIIKTCGECSHRYEDLSGQKFGKLTANYYIGNNKDGVAIWHCTCECGHVAERTSKTLKRKTSISMCNYCIREAISRRSRLNLKGKTINELTVLDLFFVYHERTYWKCRCSCGKLCIVRGKELVGGLVKSCKHLKHRTGEDNPNFVSITGNVYNYLIALEQVEGRNWKYLCTNCGNDKFVARRNDVDAGKITNCGCLNVQKSGSICENEIKNYIATLVDCIPEKCRILQVKNNKQEIDLYYREYGVGIEYNGSIFHATKGAAFENNKIRTYHRDKFLAAQDIGIHLISIFDVDWENNQEKIKMYLRSLFLPKIKLMARKCLVKPVAKDIADEFTEKYHLQGKTPYHSINYGLYNNDELVAIMSFDKLRLSKTPLGSFELHRYCVKDGYTIVGGANKLLKAFELDHAPRYLRSYSDNDYFSGGIYSILGFVNAGQCTPRYYWYFKGKELKREQCRIDHLKIEHSDLIKEAKDEKASNIEDYVMLSLGACKVFRSGLTKWEKHYENNIS